MKTALDITILSLFCRGIRTRVLSIEVHHDLAIEIRTQLATSGTKVFIPSKATSNGGAEWAVKCKFADPTEMGSQRSNRGWIRADCNGQTTIMQDGPETECVLTITGPGGGSWTFDGRDSGRVRVWEGRFDGAPEMCVSHETLERIVARKTTIEAAAQAGDLVTVGRVGDLTSWERILAAVRAQRPSA